MRLNKAPFVHLNHVFKRCSTTCRFPLEIHRCATGFKLTTQGRVTTTIICNQCSHSNAEISVLPEGLSRLRDFCRTNILTYPAKHETATYALAMHHTFKLIKLLLVKCFNICELHNSCTICFIHSYHECSNVCQDQYEYFY